MKITIAPYSPAWPSAFLHLKKEIAGILKELNPAIEHIGSTSVPGLAAKPIIDIQVGLASTDDFPIVEEKMMAHHYIYYGVFNSTNPNRRLFVRLKEKEDQLRFPNKFTNLDNIPHDEINDLRLAHIHVWQQDTPDWNRHMAFREYLKAHPAVMQAYQELKMKLSEQEWQDGMAYNDGKNAFIKTMEAKAVAWHKLHLPKLSSKTTKT